MNIVGVKLQAEQKAKLKDIIRVFLQIGATSFGSPTAHIAMMESEIVRKRKWLTSERFLELLAATHLVPGPNATELALHIGYLLKGYAGRLQPARVSSCCLSSPPSRWPGYTSLRLAAGRRDILCPEPACARDCD